MAATQERASLEGLRIIRPVEVRAEVQSGQPGSPGVGFRMTGPERAYLEQVLGDLTDRERDVVFTVCAEGTNEEAAARLNVTLATLRTHLMKVNQKLGTSSKTDVVRFSADRVIRGYRTGEIPPPPAVDGGGGDGAEPGATSSPGRATPMRRDDSSGF